MHQRRAIHAPAAWQTEQWRQACLCILLDCLQGVSTVLSSHVQNGGGLSPAVKFSFKEGAALPPYSSAPGVRAYTFTLRIPASAGACSSLPTLCGCASCLAALADESYTNCPTYIARGNA